MVSAFSSANAPTSEGADPVATADSIAQFVIQNNLDGVDIDFEDFKSMNDGTSSAVNWLVSFTNQLRTQLPQGREFSLLLFINYSFLNPLCRIHHHPRTYRSLVYR
jgi:hypothetical protein